MSWTFDRFKDYLGHLGATWTDEPLLQVDGPNALRGRFARTADDGDLKEVPIFLENSADPLHSEFVRKVCRRLGMGDGPAPEPPSDMN